MRERRSARRQALDKLAELWREVRAGSYFVKRGPIHWPAFSFKDRPLAVAILVDETTLFRSHNTMKLSFEIGAIMAETEKDLQLDEGLLDDVFDDVEWVFREFTQATNAKGDSIALRTDLENSSIQEWHDPQIRVQGVVALLTADY